MARPQVKGSSSESLITLPVNALELLRRKNNSNALTGWFVIWQPRDSRPRCTCRSELYTLLFFRKSEVEDIMMKISSGASKLDGAKLVKNMNITVKSSATNAVTKLQLYLALRCVDQNWIHLPVKWVVFRCCMVRFERGKSIGSERLIRYELMAHSCNN